ESGDVDERAYGFRRDFRCRADHHAATAMAAQDNRLRLHPHKAGNEPAPALKGDGGKLRFLSAYSRQVRRKDVMPLPAQGIGHLGKAPARMPRSMHEEEKRHI